MGGLNVGNNIASQGNTRDMMFQVGRDSSERIPIPNAVGNNTPKELLDYSKSPMEPMLQHERFATAIKQPDYPGDNPYRTYLTETDENTFKAWVSDERIPYDPSSSADYDMRGYYKDVVLKGKDKRTRNENDGQLHFPDTYKTPYHETFSNESKYADKEKAPFWVGDRFLVSPDGKVRFDDKKQRR